MPERLQRQRTKGWRMPEGAIYVGRPSPWGNPFPWDDERATWMALTVGENANVRGRRTAAVIMFRWWIAGAGPAAFPVAASKSDAPGGAIEYSSGRVVPVADLATGMGLRMYLREPLQVPPRPDLEPLRGRDLVCWCPLDGLPCHADVLLELANA